MSSRPSASEKAEIIRLVEGSELSARRTLEQLDIPRSTYYGWLKTFREEGLDGLSNTKPVPRSSWNRIPDDERLWIVEKALEYPALTSRELAWHITDYEGTFVSESSVYRILKSQDLIPSPAYIVLSAADKFPNPTRRVHELWQTDFSVPQEAA